MGRPRNIPLSSLTPALSPGSECFQSDTTAPVLHAWARLCVEMAQVEDILNSPLPLDGRMLEQLSQLYTTICTLYDNLPPDLAWHDSQSSPLHASGYALHTQICALQIVLQRIPTRSRHVLQHLDVVEDGEDVLPGFTLETSQTIIYEKAVRIARLVHLLVQVHGVEQIVPTMLDNIFVACMALILHVSSNQQQQEDPTLAEGDKQWLRVLSETLESVQKHYSMAYPIRQTLHFAARNTSVADIFRFDGSYEDNHQVQRDGAEFSNSSLRGPNLHSSASYLGSEDLIISDFAVGVSPTTVMAGMEAYHCQADVLPWCFNSALRT
jgi:hypothetical protein